ncbi:hypothetical protein EBX31_12300, partial [bacterium]|nr:hypothetical protein [bacterium]
TLNTKYYGAADFTLGATSDSGLPVSYTSSNPYVATVSGNTVTIVGVGSTVITASQAGDSNYLPATEATQTLTVQPVLSSVDGNTVSLNFQVADLAAPLSHANGWSSNDPQFRPDGYATDNLNPGNLLGYVGGFVNAPANETTQLTYNFNPGSSDRYVFQWNQNVKSSIDFPGDDVFGWKFLSGNNAAFSIRFLNDSSLGRDLLVQAYDGSGNALSLAAGQVNDWFIDRDDANDFRVTADLAAKKWALDVFNKSNNAWYGLVVNASMDPAITSLDGLAATWTVANNAFDNTTGQYTGAGDNIMTFDNVSIQGKQTVVISLNIPTNAVYNGSAQTVTPTTTPSGVALIVKYNGSTNAPINAGTYTVTAEAVDTNSYYNVPTSGSLVVAQATPTIATAPTASAINAGQALSASSLTGGSATGVGGASVTGSFAFTYPSTVPPAGTANRSVTFTPSGADAINYLTATVNVSVTVNQTSTPAEDYLSSFGLTGANAALTADPDNDGLTNAAEFAFGTSPVAATGTSVAVSDSGSSLTITFLGRTSGVDYVVKTTTDLSSGFSGTNAPTPVSPQPSGLPTGYTQYEASVDTTSGDR